MNRQIQAGPYTLGLFWEGDPPGLIVLPGALEEGEAVWKLLSSPRPALLVIDGVDWDRQLTPWPAPRAFRKGRDFSGEAREFLRDLLEKLLPLGEAQLPAPPGFLGIAGYSLGGLFALWALTQTDRFHRAASLSGSLWFDQFILYLSAHPPKRLPDRLFFSLGDREKDTKNSRMARVEACTLEAARLFSHWGAPLRMEKNPGGHFQDVPKRIARGLSVLTQPAFVPTAPDTGD